MSLSETMDKSHLTKEERAGKGIGDEKTKIEGSEAKKSLKAIKEKAQKEEKSADDKEK